MTKHYGDHYDDHSNILSDGERVRLPLMLKDSRERDMHEHQQRPRLLDAHGNPVGHRPGFVVSDAVLNRDAREQAYSDYESDLTAAYKNDARNRRLTSVPDTRDAMTMEDVYAQYCRELRNG